jgi:hypothetical protein
MAGCPHRNRFRGYPARTKREQRSTRFSSQGQSDIRKERKAEKAYCRSMERRYRKMKGVGCDDGVDEEWAQ